MCNLIFSDTLFEHKTALFVWKAAHSNCLQCLKSSWLPSNDVDIAWDAMALNYSWIQLKTLWRVKKMPSGWIHATCRVLHWEKFLLANWLLDICFWSPVPIFGCHSATGIYILVASANFGRRLAAGIFFWVASAVCFAITFHSQVLSYTVKYLFGLVWPPVALEDRMSSVIFIFYTSRKQCEPVCASGNINMSCITNIWSDSKHKVICGESFSRFAHSSFYMFELKNPQRKPQHLLFLIMKN